MRDKHFWLLQTIQAGIGFNEEDEHRLAAVASRVQLDKLTVTLPAAGEQLRPILTQWARHNLLATHDTIYAQRLWILALAGLRTGTPLAILSEAIQSLYQQIASQLSPEELDQYQDALQKGEQTDLAMLAQCYARFSPMVDRQS